MTEPVAITWWLWMLLGLVLLAGEMLTPGGFYIIFFGAAAILVGALKLLGMDIGLANEGLLFVIVSVVSLVVFRKPLLTRFQKNLAPELPVDNLSGEFACAMEEIPAGGIGKVELRGTAWNAHNLSEKPVAKAQRCRVEKVDGLMLFIRGL